MVEGPGNGVRCLEKVKGWSLRVMTRDKMNKKQPKEVEKEMSVQVLHDERS